jgi:L-2-hydroxyglutarate oxidase LhgO
MADDVTQGATKGNSGIVHAGYDDEPGTNPSKFCPKGNSMFPQLDRELHFGYQRSGSLVMARGKEDEETLRDLLQRGIKNGVQGLRIVDQAELRAMEPNVSKASTAALFAPTAGQVTPYEFTIAVCENAADNGVEFRTRREVTSVERRDGTDGAAAEFVIQVTHHKNRFHHHSFAQYAPFLRDRFQQWQQYKPLVAPLIVLFSVFVALVAVAVQMQSWPLAVVAAGVIALAMRSAKPQQDQETVRAKYMVNCAGLGADRIAAMVGDTSFKIKPRIGEYLLLHKDQGSMANHILFPAPGKMGKGVLVQKTLWGNLILGPTAADVADPNSGTRKPREIIESIVNKCRELVPKFDTGMVIHSFAGARAKSSRGDWIIEECATSQGFIHAAGIDSPGLAGSPAIALEVVRLLSQTGLTLKLNPKFNPNRRPIIVPKIGWSIERNGKRETIKVNAQNRPMDPALHVVCKCEKVTEAEIVDSIRRRLPVDSTQAVRKRTRAGMGHCQGQYCEPRVKAIIARETNRKENAVGGRAWPATSIIPQRWLTDKQKDSIRTCGAPPDSPKLGSQTIAKWPSFAD